MTFAFWPGLLLLGAVPVILIWHLRRMWHRRMTVPTVEPWVRLLGASRRRRRLPRSLLLALQLGVAACLGLAAGVPLADRNGQTSGDLAVVLDAGASGDVRALRGAALDVADTAGLVTIVSAGREPRALLARAPAERARAMLSDVSMGEAGSQLARAVVMARAVAGEGAEIVVVSPSAAPPEWPARWVTAGEEHGANRAVTHASLADGRLLATIANSDDSPVTLPVIVEADGALVDRSEVALAAHGEVDAVWRVPGDALAVTVRLDTADANDEDDRAVVAGAHVRRGQIVGTSPSMDRALGSLAGWRFARTGRATYSVDGSVDLTAFLSWTPTDLPAGGVLIAASRPAEAPTPVAASSLVASDLKPVFAVGGHPLTAGLDLAGVVVRATSPLTVPAWAEPILMAEDVPIAYAGERPEGRVVVLGFDVEDPDSGFAKRPAFPVLIARAVDWLAPLPPGAVPAGDWVDLPGGDHEVTAPDGSTATVSRRVRADSAGLYLARAGDSAVELLRFGAWAGRGGGDVPEGQDWDAARAAVAGGSPDREGASGISASSIGPELATLALVLVLAEGLWRGLGHERPPSVVRPAASRPDPQPGGRP